MSEDRPLRNYWVSWYCPPDKYGKFELHWPWWETGFRLSDNASTICAAVRAVSEHQARLIVAMAHDADVMDWASREIEWRFVDEQPSVWSPYGDRFQEADWMRWPAQDQPSR